MEDGIWILVYGFWYLVLGIGYWVLVISYWVLGFGYWVLGFGVSTSGGSFFEEPDEGFDVILIGSDLYDVDTTSTEHIVKRMCLI